MSLPCVGGVGRPLFGENGMDMIKRDDVLRILDVNADLRKLVAALPAWPAPNPNELGGRNIMGQTEAEFWDLVDSKE